MSDVNTNANGAGPKARPAREAAGSSAAVPLSRYQELLTQPPEFGAPLAVQERDTVPSLALVIRNVLPLLDVAVTV
jgi:hypothetical protein